MERSISISESARRYAWHGWLGLLLVAVFWPLNWLLPGPRTHWAFFPLWLGYCLAIDALVLYRTGTSLLHRSWRMYIGLFFISAPVWWIFEAANWRLQNWIYLGSDAFSPQMFTFWATLNFSTVIPAVFGTAELAASFPFMQRPKPGPRIGPRAPIPAIFFIAGWAMLGLMLAWPKIFFPFIWIGVYFILEPLNIWFHHRSLTEWTRNGDWRPVLSLWVGVLITAFFWEMWNYFSYPKWVYQLPWGGVFHIFEMPLLGYGGYLPFSLELYAMTHLLLGWLGFKHTKYIILAPPNSEGGVITP